MRTRSRFVRNCLIALGLPILLTVCAIGADSDDVFAGGRAALGQRDFETARQQFANVLAAARQANDPQRLADALFYLGVTAQQSAASASDPAASLATARRYYDDAIAARPKFPAALNNLAEVYLAENNPKSAGETLQRAMAAGGSREGVYAQKYADLLLREGKWKDACFHYAHAAGLQPDNASVHRQLADQCLKFDPPALIGYLWTLATQGQVLQVQRLAIEILPRSGWTAEQHDALMTMIAFCLSRQNYAPADFSRTEAAASLGEVPAEPAIRELFELHRGEGLTTGVYPWWTERIRRNVAPTRVALWPQEAFRQLACALGARWRSTPGGEEKAIGYYRLAAFLDPREPDPEALTRLAELYGRTDRLNELTEVMSRHENEIFSAKGEAYRTDKLEKIYQFHSALGVIYSTMGVWGDESTPTSAIFQLEQATMIARRAGSVRPPTATPEPTPANPFPTPPPPANLPAIKPAPQLVNLLAEAYVRTNNPAKAFDLKVDQGQEFFRVGDVAAAREVLRDVDKTAPASVSPARKATFEQLQRDIPNLNAPRKSAQLLPAPTNSAGASAVAVTTPSSRIPAGSQTVPANDAAQKAQAAETPRSNVASRRLPAAASATSALPPDSNVPNAANTPAEAPTSAARAAAKVPGTPASTSASNLPARTPASPANVSNSAPNAAANTSARSSIVPPVTPQPAVGRTPATAAANTANSAITKARMPPRVTLAATVGVDAQRLGALSNVVQKLLATPPSSGTVLALPAEAIALNVQEIAVQGSQGKITINTGTKTTTVPFTIEGGDAQRGPTALRYIRK